LIDCEINITIQPPIDKAIGVVVGEFDGAAGCQQSAHDNQQAGTEDRRGKKNHDGA
jgi:hypothetical protein